MNRELSATEKYWDATEIDRDGFVALLKFNFGTDSNGNNYIITNDNNEVERFYADEEDIAKEIYNEKRSLLNSPFYDYAPGYDEIVESEEDTTGPYSDIKIYMNTWANYNENGADLSKYGIKDGWLTVDEALEFCKKYADDEPFINDTDDNTGICRDISDYDNAVTVLKAIKTLQDYANESGQDMTFIQDMFEAWYQYEDGTLSEENINEFIKFVEEGDYHYYPDVDNSYDLGYYLVDEFGPGGLNDIERFIDYDHLQRDLQYDVDTQLSDEEWYEVDDSEVNDFIANATAESIGPYFDFEELGEAIELEQHVCYTTNGNCVSMF